MKERRPVEGQRNNQRKQLEYTTKKGQLSTSVLPSALRETERIDRNWANARPFATAREWIGQPVAEGRSVAGVRAERGLGRCSGRCCIINVAAFRALEGKWWHRSKSCLVLDFTFTAQYWAFHCSPFTTSCRTIEGRGSDAAAAIVTPLVCDWLIKNAVVTRAQVLIIVLSSFAVRTSLRPRRQHSLPPCYHNVLRTTWGARFTRTQPTES